MSALARLIQNHPYSALYFIVGLLVLFGVNELRHAMEKRALRAALRQPSPIPTPSSPVPTPVPAPKQGNGWGGTVALVLGLGALFYVVPLFQQGQGQAAAGPGQQAVASGTYRGLAAGPFSNGPVTLHVDGLAKTAWLETRLGTFAFQGDMTPESTGLFLSGELVGQGGMQLSQLNAHVSLTQVTGRVGTGPAQWQLDLRR